MVHENVSFHKKVNCSYNLITMPYHVRLIGKMIGYDLPDTSVHQWLTDQYGVDYDESKGRTFRILLWWCE